MVAAIYILMHLCDGMLLLCFHSSTCSKALAAAGEFVHVTVQKHKTLGIHMNGQAVVYKPQYRALFFLNPPVESQVG